MSSESPSPVQRYWCKRDGRFRLDDSGYLLDPDTSVGKSFNPDLAKLADVEDRDCLVLLGEPGIGKTTTLGAEKERLAQAVGPDGDFLIWRYLGEYGDEARLVREVFEAPEWERSLGGGQTLHLYLDGLDECRLHLPNVSAVILGRLQRLSRRDHLRVRITCRTGAWPQFLEDGLRELWSGDRTAAFELAPLRRRDVADIATALGLNDAALFLSEIERRDAVPLATKPVTLKLLVNLYKRGRRLPRTQAELYERGCLALCEEINPSRQAAGRYGTLSPKQRLAVAARVAAITTFCGRTAVWDGPDLGEKPGDDVTVSALGGGSEFTEAGEFEVTDAGVREILSDTGLFTSRGPRRMGWGHRTFAEYLAARYVCERGMTAGQINDLISHPHMPGRVVPQLHETAAWLAGMRPEVFRAILASDPGVLLQSDVQNTAVEDRESLVTALLRATEEGRLNDAAPDSRSGYHKLDHPGLTAQLLPVLQDKAKKVVTRRLAIDLAEANSVLGLQTALCDLALDRTEDMTLRVEAAYAVWRFGDAGTRRRMRRLLESDLGEDTKDQLKGCALRSLWPDLIAPEDLFRALTLPKNENHFGAYTGFLTTDLVRGLAPNDLPVALEWVASLGDPRGIPSIVRAVVDQVVLRAWENLRVLGVLPALSEVVWARVAEYEPIVSALNNPMAPYGFGADAARRRCLLRSLISKLSASRLEPGRLLFTTPPLATPEDFPWLIGLLDEEPENRAVVARLVRGVFIQSGPVPLDLLLDEAQRHPELAEAIRDLTTPVGLDSPEAKSLRDVHLRLKTQEQRRQTGRRRVVTPARKIEELLTLEESGDPDAWWQLTRVMAVKENGNTSGDTVHTDLIAKPGWLEASDETRARILTAAHHYVSCNEAKPGEWFHKSEVFYQPDAAGFKALRLLSDAGDVRFRHLGPDAWRKWVPIIVGYPAYGRRDDEEAQGRLAAEAYKHAPQEVLAWISELIAEQSRRDHPYFTTRLWSDFWDEQLTSTLMQAVRDPSIKVEVLDPILDNLLVRNSGEGRTYAVSLLGPNVPPEGPLRERSLVAARSLLTRAPDAGWPILWPLIRADPALGRDLLISVATSVEITGHAPFLDRLSEDNLADLYVWLSGQFPRHEDEEGFRSLGPRDFAARLRDGVLRHLTRRGTAASLGAIRRVAHQFPDLEWLSFAYLEAERMMLEKTWPPHEIAHLRALARDRQARLVESGDTLVEVVVDSVRRFERKLQGETPLSFMLWDKQSGGRYRPKEEERLSDAIKQHLQEDLGGRAIVANREVVIRSGIGKQSGERTDVHVDAFTHGPRPGVYDRLTVIVEVKGGWNREVREAMRTQLRDRYLCDDACRHGLYVVGWFLCDQWDQSDDRRRESLRLLPSSISATQEFLESQAAELSGGGTNLTGLVINMALR
jgi:hypothetical protein